MYDSPSWADFAHLLADIEAKAAAPATLAARLEQFAERPGYQADDFYPNDLEGFPGVACSDSDNPHDYRAWSINGALADARFGYFGRLWTWVSSICAEWPGVDRDRYTGPFTRATANPVLVVGNHGTRPGTPPQNDERPLSAGVLEAPGVGLEPTTLRLTVECSAD